MIESITVPQWVSLKQETRNKLREIFKVPKSTHTEIVTDQYGKANVLCDGSTNVDLQVITTERLVDYLGGAAVNETIYDLFKRAVEKVETDIPNIIKKAPEIPKIEPASDIKADSKVVGNTIKCEKCAFESASKFAMRMHVGKKHKSGKL